jgi:hypothetical protein
MIHYLIGFCAGCVVTGLIALVGWIAYTVDYLGGGHNHG